MLVVWRSSELSRMEATLGSNLDLSTTVREGEGDEGDIDLSEVDAHM